MPEPDRLKKRKEQYRKLYEQLGNIKADDKYTNEKNAVRDAFGKLNEKLNALTDNAENADKKLSKEDVFDLVTNTVSKDVKAFHVAANKEESMSVREIYESSRKYSGYKVKEGQQLSTDAGNSNVRTAITLIDEDGNEVEGYFTQDAKNNISEEIQLKKVMKTTVRNLALRLKVSVLKL